MSLTSLNLPFPQLGHEHFLSLELQREVEILQRARAQSCAGTEARG